jgi:hypothetical protein
VPKVLKKIFLLLENPEAGHSLGGGTDFCIAVL